MRELNFNELELISGAENSLPTPIQAGTIAGSSWGVSQAAGAGGTLAEMAQAGTVGGIYGAAAGLAFTGGYAAGTYLYNNTRLPDWIDGTMAQIMFGSDNF